jgi:tetrahydrodipicolinate N-succinyltransferase
MILLLLIVKIKLGDNSFHLASDPSSSYAPSTNVRQAAQVAPKQMHLHFRNNGACINNNTMTPMVISVGVKPSR